MDGVLTQDEINALLNGMDLSGSNNDTPENSMSVASPAVDDVELTDNERDAVGEIANISMGSSATTLYSLVNRKVSITTPVVSMATWDTVATDFEVPCVFVKIRYTSGLEGANIMVIKEHDVQVITDLMMGGDGTNTEGEMGELHLSAISEAMNQMMGSSATSLSTMLGTVIDISPPEASLLNLSEFGDGSSIEGFLSGHFVKISFRMQIEDLVDSTIMQLYPVSFAKSLYKTFVGTGALNFETKSVTSPGETIPESKPEIPETPETPVENADPMQNMGADQMGMGAQQMNMGINQMGMGMPQMNMGMNQMGMGMPQMNMGMPQMNVQPAQFQSFNNIDSTIPGQENIELIRDVPLEVTVELGRTKKSIAEILNFSPGTIIELDKIAGEPIDVLVNGKHVAKGEVVVIEESFGVRITEIIN